MTRKDPLRGIGFQGVYHHFDAYPAGLGRTLFGMCRDHFRGDVDQMLRFLIDEHPGGWSSINSRGGPECYCHPYRDREPEQENRINETDARDVGCQYVYVFEGAQMHIMRSAGDHMRYAATVDLLAEEPADWDKIRFDGDPDPEDEEPEPDAARVTQVTEPEAGG